MTQPLTTTTGHFGIGYRYMGDFGTSAQAAAEWAATQGFACIDATAGDQIDDLQTGGVGLGAIDLVGWSNFNRLIAADQATRDAAVEASAAFIHESVAKGGEVFLTMMLPPDEHDQRRANFSRMIESYSRLCELIRETRAKIVIEGWPGPGALCCNPETYRAALKELPVEQVGINYDPSHLVRMGIDPYRFMDEFVDRIFHVHGKDTVINLEARYEIGWEQPATFDGAPQPWKYVLPGFGEVDWKRLFRRLDQAGYRGYVSIEHEDADYLADADAMKQGLTLGLHYLACC